MPAQRPVILRGMDLGAAPERWMPDYLQNCASAQQIVSAHVCTEPEGRQTLDVSHFLDTSSAMCWALGQMLSLIFLMLDHDLAGRVHVWSMLAMNNPAVAMVLQEYTDCGSCACVQLPLHVSLKLLFGCAFLICWARLCTHTKIGGYPCIVRSLRWPCVVTSE